jgi:F420-non-reducing hydrogenase small subunit
VDTEVMGDVEVSVVDGGVRTEEEVDKLREIRAKSRYLVAWGTCAVFGGVPAMANRYELEELIEEAYGGARDSFSYYLSGAKGVRRTTYQQDELALRRRAGRVDDFVRVDYYVPGCPPEAMRLTSLMSELGGEEEPRAKAVVCSECARKPDKRPVETFDLAYHAPEDTTTCMTSHGTLCMGFMTRGGCGAACPTNGLPCWGCRGASKGALAKMDQGRSWEQVMTASFARRCKVAEEDVAEVVRALRHVGNSCLGLGLRDNDGARYR